MNAIVLGFDGATFDLILPAVERGELPGFARLMREGAWGPLRSTLPADSPSAWTSFATGVNPGRHGVYGFMARQPDRYGYEIGSSAMMRVPTFWERAGGHCLRVGVVNVPFTYPPRPVNGFLVAGMMTPDLKSPFTHPPELREALLRAFPNYSISHGLGRGRGDARQILAHDFASSIATREQAMRWLAERHHPDVLVCVFTIPDRLQHFLWADMDARHPDHDPSAPREYAEAIAEAYRRLDGVIVRTLEAADDDTLVVVLSDHGFEAVARTFYVNAWLAERGLLVLTGGRSEAGLWMSRMARLARGALAFLPGSAGLRERLRARRLISRAFTRAIDWPRTRAWFGLDRGLWLNVEGRDPSGTVQPAVEYERLRSELIAELESLEDPETRHAVVRRVHRREDVYHGPELSRSPDLIIEPARHAEDPRGRYVLSERLGFRGPAGFVGPSAPISGYHAPEGILMVRGGGVRAGARMTGAEIVDVAPSILAALQVPGGKEMDGKALFGSRERGTPAGRPPAGKSVGPDGAKDRAAMSEGDQRRVEEQLKNLGYLD